MTRGRLPWAAVPQSRNCRTAVTRSSENHDKAAARASPTALCTHTCVLCKWSIIYSTRSVCRIHEPAQSLVVRVGFWLSCQCACTHPFLCVYHDKPRHDMWRFWQFCRRGFSNWNLASRVALPSVLCGSVSVSWAHQADARLNHGRLFVASTSKAPMVRPKVPALTRVFRAVEQVLCGEPAVEQVRGCASSFAFYGTSV